MSTTSEGKVYDVVIIGAGPAGLVAASWMAVAGVKTLLVDEKPSPPSSGHADGLESRTFEILDTFGLGHDIWRESNQTIEVCLWNESSCGAIERVFTHPNSGHELSSYSEATLAQGRIEQHLLGFLGKSPAVEVLRSHRPTFMDIDHDGLGERQGHPIQLEISACDQTKDKSTGAYPSTNIPSRHVRCRYLLGCDGAHSWVRKCVGLKLEGSGTDDHWGVIDCVPITDFPDVRKRCIIQSVTGSIMLIPRERGLVRFYVKLSHSHRTESRDLLRSIILSRVGAAMRPYSFHTEIVDWVSAYSVGQRMCRVFSIYDRIFLAGDAVHTHSPKAGQGMNTSMQDAYNLGWKIASVVHGLVRPEILRTYQQERLPIAERLLAFDKEIYQAISLREESLDHRCLMHALQKENSSASGLSATYRANLLISAAGARDQGQDGLFSDCETSLRVGSRMPDVQILNHSDARLWNLHSVLAKRGQWNLVVFAGDVTDEDQMLRVRHLGMELSRPSSIFHRAARRQKGHGFGNFEIFLIHSAPRSGFDLHCLPTVFVPRDGSMGFDYMKVFADGKSYDGQGGVAYSRLGVPKTGCMTLIRPDHHIAFSGRFEETMELEDFISGFWISRS